MLVVLSLPWGSCRFSLALLGMYLTFLFHFGFVSLAQTVKANRLENLKFSDSFSPFHDCEIRTSFHEGYSYGRNVPRDLDSEDCGQRSSILRRQLGVDNFDCESAEVADYLSHFERVARWNGWSHEEKGIQLAMNLRGAAQQVLRCFN